MNTGALIVAAVGGYGLWLYTQRAEAANAPAPAPGAAIPAPVLIETPAPAPAGGGGFNETAAGQAPAPTNNAPAPATDRDVITRLAATGQAAAVAQAEALGIKYNADQWNWFRQAAGAGITTADLFPTGDRSYLMGATEYLGRRAAAGLSGVDDTPDAGVMVFAAVAILAALAVATSKG